MIRKHRRGRALLCAAIGLFVTLAIPVFAAPADDAGLCASNTAPADQSIEACTRRIASGIQGRERATALSYRAISRRQKNEADAALADLSEAIRVDPTFAYAYRQRGMTYLIKDQVDQAIADHTQALRLDPKSGITYFERGRAYYRKREKQRASEDFDAAIGLDRKVAANVCSTNDAAPDDGIKACTLRIDSRELSGSELARTYRMRGISWNQKDDAGRAIADLSEAIRLDPAEHTGYLQRGSAYRKKQDLQRALTDFSQAIRLKPDYAIAYTRRGQTYESLNDRERALADYRAVLSLPAPTGKDVARETASARVTALQVADIKPTNTRPPTPGPSGDRRVALVMGNSAYKERPLKNPARDARVTADALRSIGFEVLEGTDLGYDAMNRLIREFLSKAVSARVALLFFSGHGAQIDGKNYLLPTDSKRPERATIGFEQIDLDLILAGLDDDNRSNIVIIDACRNNPYVDTSPSSTRAAVYREGLAPYATVGAGTLIAFATSPGKTASDGSGDNSPFTASLVKHIRTPGLEVYSMLTRVRVDVAGATQRKQIPWVNSSLLGEVYLAGTPRTAGPGAR